MMICHRDRKQKQKIKQFADKKHTAMMKIKAGGHLTVQAGTEKQPDASV